MRRAAGKHAHRQGMPIETNRLVICALRRGKTPLAFMASR